MLTWVGSPSGGAYVLGFGLVLVVSCAAGLLWREVKRRRRVESNLRRFAQTIDNSPESIISVATDGTILSWNPAAERIYGYAAAEAIGLNISMLVPDDLRDEARRLISQLTNGEPIEEHETIRLHRDGEPIRVTLSASPIRDSRGRVVALTSISQNITERKQTEAAHNQLFDLSVDLMCVVGTDGYFKRVNPAFTRVLGHDDRELMNRTLLSFVHPDDRPAAGAELQRLAEGEFSMDFRNRFQCADGSYKWLSWTAAPDIEDQRLYAVARDVTDHQFAQDKLRWSATHDKLTGLANRRLLTEQLERALQRARQDPDRQFAVLYLDLDRFKIINDSLGHETGDLLLKAIAQRMRSHLRIKDVTGKGRTYDLPARLGGDEFVILLHDVRNPGDAELVAERLQEVLSTPYELAGHEVTSTASIGIVTSDRGYSHAQEILRDADLAMYHAKNNGKASHAMFDERMHRDALRRLHLEHDLRRAIQDMAFVVNYQPIISLDNGAVTGFEALVRWPHPEYGMVPPSEFIPLAEELGLIVPLGRWVLEQACARLAAWQRRFEQHPRLTMNVNLSKRQLFDPKLIDDVRGAIRRTGIEPGTLKLEITESVIVDCHDRITDVLNQLRGLGVRFCMDDFGTGLSSLSCLHRFPIDVLKVDRSFINNMEEHREYTAVIQAIVMLAQTLGMSVVAEGIENASQLAQLQALDCDQAQGFYFARPMTAGDAEDYLSRPDELAKSA